MRMSVWFLTLSLAAGQVIGVSSQPGAPRIATQPEVKPEDRCTVEGVVVNAATKEPLKKARVTLYRSDAAGGAPIGTTTDASGKFRLTDIDPGEYRIMADRNGFTHQSSSAWMPDGGPPALTLAARQSLKDLKLELSPAAAISGRVVDEDGEPLANVRIATLRYLFVQGRRQLVPAGGNAGTDDQGAYRLFGLEAGRYYVSATYSDAGRGGVVWGSAMTGGMGSAAGLQEEGYAPVYYPGAPESSQAAPIELRAGEERRAVDFRLTPVRTIRITGRVTPVPPRPQEVFLNLMPRNEGIVGFLSQRGPSRVDEKGAFEIRGVTPGSYTLIAVTSHDGGALTAHQAIEAGNTNIENVQITLKTGVELKGRLLVEGDPNQRIKGAEMRVLLTPTQRTMGFGGVLSEELGADGAFTLKNVGEGEYRVGVFSIPEGCYLKAVKYGNADALANGLSVVDAGGKIEVVISAQAGQVEGAVTDDDKPAPGAVVTLVPESGREDMFEMSQSDQNGRFSIHGVAPGEYSVYAWDSAEAASASQDAKSLEGYKDKAAKITVEEKGRATVDVGLIHAKAE